MARIAGVDLPRDKRSVIALTYIYGVGPTRSREILASTGVDGSLRVWDVASGKVVREFAGMGQGSRVAFTADGQSVVVAGGDEMIRVFGRKP